MIDSKILKLNSNPSNKVWTTALYVRSCLRCGKNNKNSNIVMQKEALQSFLLNNPEFKLFDIYIDNGYSGLNFYRPEFLRMMDDVSNKKVDCIIVVNLSKLGRNAELVDNYIDNVFPKNKVRFISLEDKYDSANLTLEQLQLKCLKKMVMENSGNV